ncbi:MAG: fumarate reductase subunit C [Acidobacteria bacterium]|nr:fumarate reductase subunit C [Acidobacteriota bacterium]MCW5970143.1 hypothetical protein [Blastocatellales bacterium]
MKQPVTYTLYHPKWYRRPMSTYWWTKRWRYLRFILRELSSISVAWTVILLLLLINSMGDEAMYAGYLDWLQSPWLVVLNAFALVFLLFHTVTWFNLAPRAMAVRLRGKRLPDWAVAAPNFIAWAVLSAGVVWFVLKGV